MQRAAKKPPFFVPCSILRACAYVRTHTNEIIDIYLLLLLLDKTNNKQEKKENNEQKERKGQDKTRQDKKGNNTKTKNEKKKQHKRETKRAKGINKNAPPLRVLQCCTCIFAANKQPYTMHPTTLHMPRVPSCKDGKHAYTTFWPPFRVPQTSRI